MGVGCPCPPIRNDIVTPRHLFFHEFQENAEWGITWEGMESKVSIEAAAEKTEAVALKVQG